jgi:hypothetical protein
LLLMNLELELDRLGEISLRYLMEDDFVIDFYLSSLLILEVEVSWNLVLALILG